ncbi:MAG: arginine--tRNA ligase [Parcubacteria group bacterium]|nr:arginine--tRNA ligase [Parcubacteria group bacterium]
MGYTPKQMKNRLRQAIHVAAVALAQEQGWDSEIPSFDVERPSSLAQGDYATNIALILAKHRNEESFAIAEKLREKLVAALSSDEVSVSTAGQGFINFSLSNRMLERETAHIVDEGQYYGTLDIGKGERLHIEFISVNPTGEIHVGHGRGSFYGDALANIYEKAGYAVTREYYVNDARASGQIQELGTITSGSFGGRYHSEYIDEVVARIPGLSKESDAGERGYRIAQEIQKDIKAFITQELRIRFDYWFSEEELHQKNAITDTLDNLRTRNLVYEKDGATWFKATDLGDAQDWVLMRSNGAATYFLTDMAHLRQEKFQGSFAKVVTILGADHQGHVKKMNLMSKLYGFSGEFVVLILQMVGIQQRGETKRLSKRLGTILLLKDLIREAGIDAVRYFYLTRSLDAQMTFDVDLAQKRTQENPVYYIQYAHARMASIFRKRENSQLPPEQTERAIAPADLTPFEMSRVNLQRTCIQFPDWIEEAATTNRAHILTVYAYELARKFQDFYEASRRAGRYIILDDALLTLVRATQIVLRNTLALLGISTPERMDR